MEFVDFGAMKQNKAFDSLRLLYVSFAFRSVSTAPKDAWNGKCLHLAPLFFGGGGGSQDILEGHLNWPSQSRSLQVCKKCFLSLNDLSGKCVAFPPACPSLN